MTLQPWIDLAMRALTDCVKASKLRLNQPKKQPLPWCSSWLTGLSIVAQRAGVSVRATTTESAMAETMVTENWR